MNNYYEGQFFRSKKTGDVLKICHVETLEKKLAVVNIKKISKGNCRKPDVFKFGDFFHYCQRNIFLECTDSSGHIALTSSDTFIEKRFGKVWLTKRDKKWGNASLICTEENVRKYLYGNGIADEIREAISKKGQTHSAFLHAINRFITFGCTKNAFLPLGYSECGIFDRLNSKLQGTKVGCCGSDNRNSRSKTRAVTPTDQEKIKECIAEMLKYFKHFSWSKAFDLYQKANFIVLDDEGRSKHVLPEEERISFGQFYYHAKRLVPDDVILKKRVGKISFEKDHTPRHGSASDGVLGATDRFEIDATLLDIHIRYSQGPAMKLSAGRPVLYLVVDTYSGMIVGMHLAVGNSVNVTGVCQALANAFLPKKEFAARYGIKLSETDWPANHICRQVTTDNGPEYLQILNASLLRPGLGIEIINRTQAYRGDRKGGVERKFGTTNQKSIHFLPGAILKNRDKNETDPSNDATLTYDELMKELIRLIIEVNQNSICPERLNHAAAHNGIKPTPQEIYLHSLKTQMHGGRPTTMEQAAKVYWHCLPEEEATVREDGVFIDGLTYHSDLIESMGFYKRALSKARFKIQIKRLRDWTNIIWFRADNGQIIQLDLKNVNNDSPYQRLSWDIFAQMQSDLKDTIHQLTVSSLDNSVRIDQLVSDTTHPYKLTRTKNSQRSRQKTVKQLSGKEKAAQLNKSGHELNRLLTSESKALTKTVGGGQQQFLEDLYGF